MSLAPCLIALKLTGFLLLLCGTVYQVWLWVYNILNYLQGFFLKEKTHPI